MGHRSPHPTLVALFAFLAVAHYAIVWNVYAAEYTQNAVQAMLIGF